MTGERPLKEVTIAQINEIFSKALTELLGQKYKAEVRSIDFEPKGNSDLRDTSEMHILVCQNKYDT